MADKKKLLAKEIALRLRQLDRYQEAADLFRTTTSEGGAQTGDYLRQQSDFLAEEIESLLREFHRLA